jgi:membrane protease YdiL (CAAX protease family)
VAFGPALVLVFLWMLMPWPVMSWSLYQAHDFRLAFAAYHILCCLLPVAWMSRRNPRLELKLGVVWWPTVGLVLLGNLAILGLWLLYAPSAFDFEHFRQNLANVGIDPVHHLIPAGLYFILINPVIEELFWRGLVYRQLRERWGVRPAMLVSSLFFGAWHWTIAQAFFTPEGALLGTALIVIGGVAFAWLYEKTQQLGSSIVVHSLGADLPLLGVVWMGLNHYPATGGILPPH